MPQVLSERKEAIRIEMADKASVKDASIRDRRIARTHAALRAGLIELIEEQGLDNISVGDLCAAANITRGTFYNHFKDKDTLVRALEDEVIAGLDVFQERMADLSLPALAKTIALKQPLGLLVEMFEYLYSEADLLQALFSSGGDASFGPRLRDSICTNLVQSILNKKYRNSDDSFVAYYVAFYASAYLGVIGRWVETGMQESPEEMARIAARLLFIRPGEPIKL